MATLTDRTIVVDGLSFPESPVWKDGLLWFADMHAHTIHSVTPDGQLTTIATVPDMPSGVGFLPDGRLLVGMRRQRQLLAGHRQDLSLFADLTDVGGVSIGNFVARHDGTIYLSLRAERGYSTAEMTLRDGEQGDGDWLVRLDPSGDRQIVADGLIGPYNCMLSSDERTLIVDEARGQRLTAFDIEADGTLVNRRVHIQLDDRPIGGASPDQDGAVWVGTPLHHQFVRISKTNEVTDVIEVEDGVWAVGCEHGGADGRTLFLMVVETTLENQALLTSSERDALSTARGRIEKVQVSVPGVG